MRLITRDDASLSVALVAATVILFQQPLRYVLDIVRDIEGRYHLDLLPALLLLTFVFTFHQSHKRMQAAAAAKAAAADAALARTQSRTLADLMTLSRELANALDEATLQQVLWTHLPPFVPGRRFWMLARRGDHWQVIIQDRTTDRRTQDELERLANDALASSGRQTNDYTADGDICFPMLAAGGVVGVMGVSATPPLTEEHTHLLDAAAAVIAIAVRNMTLFLETRELSLKDGLTGCFNRAYALEALDTELRRARRTGHPLSTLLVDVDDFKSINDRFGHLRGDELLAAIGEQLARTLRTSDVRCRYGGDEFLVILPETPSLGAQQVAEALRQSFAKLTIAADHAAAFTISVGVAAAVPGELEGKRVIARADEALYRAKTLGRNRVSVAVPPSITPAVFTPPAHDSEVTYVRFGVSP